MEEFSDSELEDDCLNMYSNEDIVDLVGIKPTVTVGPAKSFQLRTVMAQDQEASSCLPPLLDRDEDAVSLSSLESFDVHGEADPVGLDYQPETEPRTLVCSTPNNDVVLDDASLSSVGSLGILDHLPGNTDPDGTDYQPETEPSSDESAGSHLEDVAEDPGVAVTKRRKRGAPEQWKRIKNKKLRMNGKKYLGFTRPPNQNAKQNKEREERPLKPTCSSKLCQKSKVRFCSGFSEEIRKEIFQKFWTDMNWDQRKMFVASHVNVVETKRTSEEESRRKGSLQYSLSLGSVRKSVCKTMFLNTLSLGEWSVSSWARQAGHGMCQSTNVSVSLRDSGELRRGQRKTVAREFATAFLDSLPKLPSHYCRKNTSKLYLEPGVFFFKGDVFNLYKSRCVEEETVALFTFDALLEENNIRVFSPEKDQCDTCCQHETGNLSGVDWQAHIKNKDRARCEKETDKKNAIEHKCHVYTMDLMAVKL